MEDAGKEFDRKMLEHANLVDEAVASRLELLLVEIKTFDYSTVEQVSGAIHTMIDNLQGVVSVSVNGRGKRFTGDELTSPEQQAIIFLKSIEKDPLDE